jgi:hypothetical protein
LNKYEASYQWGGYFKHSFRFPAVPVGLIPMVEQRIVDRENLHYNRYEKIKVLLGIVRTAGELKETTLTEIEKILNADYNQYSVIKELNGKERMDAIIERAKALDK